MSNNIRMRKNINFEHMKNIDEKESVFPTKIRSEEKNGK